ncbi:MAG: TonB-dependent receptor [Azonexus sp.]|nr:TonB-dependent receptor [Azonexus sp.]
MHKPLAVAALLAASCGAQAAGDADLAAIRSQIDEMKKSYEQRIAALEQRLAQAEADAKARPMPVAQVPAPVAANPSPAASGALTAASAFNPEVSLILQGQYAQMQNVPDRTITGFWPAGGHDDHGKGISTRGFSLNHTELVFSAGIDPYWRGQAIFAVQDEAVEVEEAWFQSLAIGHGIGLKGGRYLSGIGYLNEQHPHQWDFANAPLMYNALFGQEASYRQDGLQLKWLAPTPVFVEFGTEVGRGANFPGTDSNKNGAGAWAAYVHVGDDLGVANSWRTGLSYLKTSSGEREADFVDINGLQAQGLFNGDTATWIADFVWKWAPDGNPKYRNFKFQSEYFVRKDKGELTCTDGNGVGNACATPVTGDYDTRQRGWYAQGVYQFTPNWRAGLRYDQLDSGRQNLGANAASLVVQDYRPKRATAMVDYSWSEFSRVRLQYAQDRSMAGITDNQWIVQYIMSLGAHGVHKF